MYNDFGNIQARDQHLTAHAQRTTPPAPQAETTAAQAISSDRVGDGSVRKAAYPYPQTSPLLTFKPGQLDESLAKIDTPSQNLRKSKYPYPQKAPLKTFKPGQIEESLRANNPAKAKKAVRFADNVEIITPKRRPSKILAGFSAMMGTLSGDRR